MKKMSPVLLSPRVSFSNPSDNMSISDHQSRTFWGSSEKLKPDASSEKMCNQKTQLKYQWVSVLTLRVSLQRTSLLSVIRKFYFSKPLKESSLVLYLRSISAGHAR